MLQCLFQGKHDESDFLHRRELEMPIESLKLSTIWDGISIARSQTQLKVVAFLSGIYIQGATMKLGNGLEECNAETPSWSSVPTCSVSWIPDDKVNIFILIYT